MYSTRTPAHRPFDAHHALKHACHGVWKLFRRCEDPGAFFKRCALLGNLVKEVDVEASGVHKDQVCI